MSDAKTPQQKVEEDASICPFCGRVDSEACDHLLADFSIDLSDEDGGVLAKRWVKSILYDSARDFGLACSELLITVCQGGGDKTLAQQARLKAMVSELSDQEWWGDVLDRIDNHVENNVANNEFFDPGDRPIDFKDVLLGDLATHAVNRLVRGVPGVPVGTEIQGGMTSSYVTFVWSDDREAATKALEARIGKATKAVRRVASALAKEAQHMIARTASRKPARPAPKKSKATKRRSGGRASGRTKAKKRTRSKS